MSAILMEEALAVRQTVLGRAYTHDHLVWHYDNRGFYTVRSGYKTLCNLVDDEDRGPEVIAFEKEVLPSIRAANDRYLNEAGVEDNVVKENIFGCFNSTLPSEIVKCKAPGRGVYKINFDGGFHASSRTSSFGAVARDSDGQVLGAVAGPILLVTDSFAAEALAASKAILWARDMGFRDVVLEGDSLTIIRKVNSSSPDLNPIGPYIEQL
ncbi:hypothetical protein CCACVL1_23617 [Corchorus capsularis]|uniref:RNase H type-1 domain-containing protein n=1 Tax=Corchorus capsularis TaxID=210143 RepID=A0A1R3GT89_COCAP|nr:hypothetical protein CCACVL1_23617 [Corchorus capsularis]